MKRIIITGASGFVGNNLARRLLREGHEVHLLLRRGHKSWRLKDILDNVKVHLVDLHDKETLTSVMHRICPHWIFHLAAYGAYSSQNDLIRMAHTNILGTINLVEACLKTGFEAFVNTGSSSEYGFRDHAPHETEWLEPNSHYAITKASATLYCRYTGQKNRVPITTLRLYSVYGPYEEPTRLMPTLIREGLNKKLPPLVNPDVARDYVHVDDVCEAYLLATSAPGREPGAVYNVGTGVQTTIREVVEVARRVLNISAIPKWGSMKDRIWDTHIWIADNRSIKNNLGWHPKHNFEAGFRKMVAWLHENPRILKWYCTHNKGLK